MGQIITIFNLKDKMGRTTTAVNLSKILASRGRTLLIDLDPIGDSTKYFGVKGKYSMDSILSKSRDFPEVVNKCSIQNLFIIPATPKLISWTNDKNNLNSINGLASVLEYLNGKFENIIIDTSSQETKLLEIAINSSNKIILPVKVEYSAIYFLKKAVDYLENKNKIPDILPTMYRDENIEIYKNIIKSYGNFMIKFFGNAIKIDDGTGSSFGFQQLAISSYLN